MKHPSTRCLRDRFGCFQTGGKQFLLPLGDDVDGAVDHCDGGPTAHRGTAESCAASLSHVFTRARRARVKLLTIDMGQLRLGACADLVALDFHIATYDARTTLSGACQCTSPYRSHLQQKGQARDWPRNESPFALKLLASRASRVGGKKARSRGPSACSGQASDLDECRRLRLMRDHLSKRDLRRIRNELLEILFLRPLGRDAGRVLRLAGGVEQAGGPDDAVA